MGEESKFHRALSAFASRGVSLWIVAVLFAGMVALGLGLHEVDRKTNSNIRRLDTRIALLSGDYLATTRAIAITKVDDLDDKYQVLATRLDAAAIGAHPTDVPGTTQTCQGQSFDAKAKLVCSKAFYVQGICGKPQPEMPPLRTWSDVVWATVPWEPNPITIVGASADLKGNGTFLGDFIGNSYTPDPVTPFHYALNNSTMVALHNEMVFPAGSGMAFPAASEEKRVDHTSHLDLHLACAPNGSSYEGYVFIWYVQ